MSANEAKKNAARFLKDQTEIMKKYGAAPKLKGPEYRAALLETARTFESLSAARSERAFRVPRTAKR